MIYVIIYFIFLYSFVAVIISSTGITKKKKPILLCVLLISPILPYIWIEVQTTLLKPQLMNVTKKAVRELGMPNVKLVKLKVLSISSAKAKIYIVSRNQLPSDVPNAVFCGSDDPCICYGGDIIYLSKISQRWKFNGDYSAVWSDCGSADGNIFPPYLSKGDY